MGYLKYLPIALVLLSLGFFFKGDSISIAQARPYYTQTDSIDFYYIDDDFICFTIQYEGTDKVLAEVEAVGTGELNNKVRYGVAEYELLPKEVNSICYYPKIKDFSYSKGYTYKLEVALKDRKITSEVFIVERSSLGHELAQFIDKVIFDEHKRLANWCDSTRYELGRKEHILCASIMFNYALAVILVGLALLIILYYKKGILTDIEASKIWYWIGLYLVIDGFVSFIIYRQQSIVEHIPRFLRLLVGLYMISKLKRGET